MDAPFLQITAALQEALKNQENGTFSNLPDGQSPAIDKNNFHPIGPIIDGHPAKIAFIDGGNAELIAAANFSLHAINVACCVYAGQKKISALSKSGYALVTAKGLSGKLSYEATFFGYVHQKIHIEALHPSITLGFQRPSPGVLASPIRKAMELNLAAEAALTLEGSSWIALDGDFSAPTPFEQDALNALLDICSRRNIGCLALAKTSEVLSEKGVALIPNLKKEAPKLHPWFYAPIPQNDIGTLHPISAVALLHKKSSHCFKIEVMLPNTIQSIEPSPSSEMQQLTSLLGSLAENAKDSVFLGYPYGFIEADQLARVSNQEKEYQKTKLLSALGKKIPEIYDYLATKDAHAILDRLRY